MARIYQAYSKAFQSLFALTLSCGLLLGFSACGQNEPPPEAEAAKPVLGAEAPATLVEDPAYLSYSKVDLSTNPVAPAPTPTGSTSITAFSVSNTSGAVFQSNHNTWSVLGETGIEFTLNLSHPTLIQLAFKTAAVITEGNSSPTSTVNIKVNNQSFISGFTDTNVGWHTVQWNIPQHLLNSGSNTIVISVSAGSSPYFVQKAIAIPQKIYAENNVLNTTIFAQFGVTDNITGTNPAQIWTRGYGLIEDIMMIPAPTFYFKPTDLLNVTLNNQLTGDNLEKFEAAGYDNLSNNPDEVLENFMKDAGHPGHQKTTNSLKHEVNIPHNLNNTNLHVHGLHVDPSKDDVTIIIAPEGEDISGYDVPDTDSPDGNIADYDEGSLSDQSVKQPKWDYEYKIPGIHLPGTHWYHPHKHGSTAAQLEQGMAGSIVIQEDAMAAIFPFTVFGCESTAASCPARESWEDNHDHVLMIQEIANYGVQEGGAGQNSKNPLITINGDHNPTRTITAGQMERWRFVNAGANHRAFNHMWLGKYVGCLGATGSIIDKTKAINDCTVKGGQVFTSEELNVVAVDGITMSSLEKATAKKPLLLAPGNRADVLIKLSDTSAPYKLFKYFPTSIAIAEDDDSLLWDCRKYVKNTNTGNVTTPCSGTLKSAFAPTSNPYLFTPNSTTLQANTNNYDENFDGFTKQWKDRKGTVSKKAMVPLIQVTNNNGSLDITYASGSDITSGKWQPNFNGFGGGKNLPATLMTINVVAGTPAVALSLPTPTHLKTIAPTGTMTPPKYVGKFEDKDILQSRPVIFDLSGASVTVTDPAPGKSSNNITVNQFTLNGRPFALNDPIGNTTSVVDKRLGKGVTANTVGCVDVNDPSGTSAGPTGSTNVDCDPDQDPLNINEQLTFGFPPGSSAWTNEADNETYFWTNPSYFQDITLDTSTTPHSYHYKTDKTPDWTAVSGIDTPAVVNLDYKDFASNTAVIGEINGLPGMPVAKTGEEWILINNSDIGHPFHIHINPFFVTEVGQLTYTEADGWGKTNATYDSATGEVTGDIGISNFVGNWWDTVIVPPHGYVKVRYWINVPNQTGSGASAQVTDNFNKEGIWVYHCHILRHEDRGMMMPVITQKGADYTLTPAETTTLKGLLGTGKPPVTLKVLKDQNPPITPTSQ